MKEHGQATVMLAILLLVAVIAIGLMVMLPGGMMPNDWKAAINANTLCQTAQMACVK